MGKSSKKPYDERSDDEKLLSSWGKAKGFFEREDWSASIMRVATATEIASNIYIRHFLQERHELPEEFVDSLLMSANGISGKFKQLVRPASTCLDTWSKVKLIQKKIESLNSHRNEIAHSGKFKNKRETKVVFGLAFEIINCLAPSVKNQLTLPFNKS